MIVSQDSDAVFWLPLNGEQDYSGRQSALRLLHANWPKFCERQKLDDKTYVLELAEYLQNLAALRVKHVTDWVDSNLSRFSPEIADIQSVRRHLEASCRDTILGIQICGLECASCALRCVEGTRHG